MTKEVVTKPQQKLTIESLLGNDKVKQEIGKALPKHLKGEKFLRIALTELRLNPKLQQCNPYSFLGALLRSAQLGLEPGSTLGYAYLIPYGNECQFIIGYKGMINLATRSGVIKRITASEIYENDNIQYEKGSKPYLSHKPALINRGECIAYYALANYNDGDSQFEIMNVDDIELVKKSSKTSNNGPWVTHYNEMAKKTVIRRLFKYLTISTELTEAIVADEQADVGIQKNAMFAHSLLGAVSEEMPAYEEQEKKSSMDMLDEKLS